MRFGRDVPGNITFGYIGRHAGISGEALIVGAGIAQALDDIRTGSAMSGVDFFSDFGDSPEDREAIIMGIALYEMCGDFCTEQHVRTVLEALRRFYVDATQESNRAECRPNS